MYAHELGLHVEHANRLGGRDLKDGILISVMGKLDSFMKNLIENTVKYSFKLF